MGVHPAFEPGYKPVRSEPGMSASEIYTAVSQTAVSNNLSALYILGADPVGDGLMTGRGELSFLVVQELFMTETAKIADVVLPAQSWAEREGTFTSGERRVQRYYPAIQPRGDSRPDWQILAQVGERVGLGTPPLAASLVFRDISRKVRLYKGMDYRSLGQVVKQWPDVGGEDSYYGGAAYENGSGLGQQWQETGAKEAFELPEIGSKQTDGLQIVRVAALYTPGTLLNQSDVLAPRLAQPTLHLHYADADSLGVADGHVVEVDVNGRSHPVTISIDKNSPHGIALLSGVQFVAGTAVANIRKTNEKQLA